MTREENNKRNENKRSEHGSKGGESIGNMQRTTQTGGQSSGGNMMHNKEDEFTEDLRQSGRRKSRGKDKS